MAKAAYQIRPGRSLGPFHLGASLKETLTRLKTGKAEKDSVGITYSKIDSVTPIVVSLHKDGVRLRFDGPEQRLRLIEIIDFSLSVFTYNSHEIYRPEHAMSSVYSLGPTYLSIAKMFGPTFAPEYVAPHRLDKAEMGTCILSYPGLAFSFPVDDKSVKNYVDTAAILASSALKASTSLAIFHGRSWKDIRGCLFSSSPPVNQPPHSKRARTTSIPANPLTTRDKDLISLIKIHGQGRIELFRSPTQHPINIVLSQTTPQDLISELGPPDAIYRPSDRRLSIHQQARASLRKDDGEGAGGDPRPEDSFEHFYNYFHLGIDILISTPKAPSPASPTMPEAHVAPETLTDDSGRSYGEASTRQVVTKLLIHGNVPSSFDFGRYARCRWSLEHVPSATDTSPLTSEMNFPELSARLREVWGGGEGKVRRAQGRKLNAGDNEGRDKDQGMLLQRGWMSEDVDVGFGLGGGAEVVGPEGWEEGDGRGAAGREGNDDRGEPDGQTTRLFGFPGLVFEVLENDVVACLTVY